MYLLWLSDTTFIIFTCKKEQNIKIERQSLINALGCTRDEAQVDKYLAKSIDPESVIR